MNQLSSAASTNVKAVMWGAAAALVPTITAMSDGWEKTWLITLFCIMMMVVNWKTAGSGLTPEEGAALKDAVLNPDETTIQDALRQGRQ